MSLVPSPTELAARARADLRLGLPVALSADDTTALAASAETLDAARLADMRALGDPVLAVTVRRAETLKARAYSDHVARIRIPHEVGPDWLASVADPSIDLMSPLKGPFDTLRGGDERMARTAVDLCKSAHLLPAAVVVELAAGSALPAQLTHIDVATLPPPTAILAEVSHARVPLSVSRAGRVHVFRPEDGGEEHYAVEIGRPDRSKPVLSRLHSACFTGDVLGSLKCDCGPQLHAALEAMAAEGAGVLLYLNQEGRGIGLANKMRAYSLQDQGFDTVEANHRLGFEDDERDFRLGAEILKRMGFKSVRLMTNNPAKVAMMEAQGITVTERVPLKAGHTADNARYLATKAAKSGHLL